MLQRSWNNSEEASKDSEEGLLVCTAVESTGSYGESCKRYKRY